MGRPITFCKDKMTSYRRRNRSRTSPIQDYNKFVVITSRTKQPVQNRDEKDTVGLYKVGAVKYYEDLNTEQRVTEAVEQGHSLRRPLATCCSRVVFVPPADRFCKNENKINSRGKNF